MSTFRLRPRRGSSRRVRSEEDMKVTRTVKNTLETYDVGKTKLYEMIRNGQVETTNVGRRRLIVDASMRRALHLTEAA